VGFGRAARTSLFRLINTQKGVLEALSLYLSSNASLCIPSNNLIVCLIASWRDY
jgi:hypothetical protein